MSRNRRFGFFTLYSLLGNHLLNDEILHILLHSWIHFFKTLLFCLNLALGYSNYICYQILKIVYTISSEGRQGRFITHAFTIALHSMRSHTIILPYFTNIPLSFSALSTSSIHPICGLPLNVTSDPINVLFINQPNLLHSFHVSKPPQQTLLCSPSQLS